MVGAEHANLKKQTKCILYSFYLVIKLPDYHVSVFNIAFRAGILNFGNESEENFLLKRGEGGMKDVG